MGLLSGRRGQRHFCKMWAKLSIQRGCRVSSEGQEHACSTSSSDRFDKENFPTTQKLPPKKPPGYHLSSLLWLQLLLPLPQAAFTEAAGCNFSHWGIITGAAEEAELGGNHRLLARRPTTSVRLIAQQQEGAKEPRKEEICKGLHN